MQHDNAPKTSRRSALAILFVLAVALAAPCVLAAPSGELLVYVGTYTGPKSQGIYVFRFDPATGKATKPELAAQSESPSFLAIHPSGKNLYAVNEVSQLRGEPWGGVSAFSIDAHSGKLTFLNEELSGGAGPCHLAVDKLGKSVLVANYGGGSVAAFAIRADGKLDPPATVSTHRGSSASPRQKEPHAHAIVLDAANRFAFVPDLGLDRLVAYRFFPNENALVLKDPPSAGKTSGVPIEPGSGPRHLAFTPDGRFAYAINEILCTVTAFAYDAEKGDLRTLGTVSTLPEKRESGYSTAEIEVHPSGKFVYGSNRGHDSIAVFAIDQEKGMLSPVEVQPTRGKTPRSFGIDPGGAWLLAANQDSDTIVVFQIDAGTGRLKATGTVIDAPAPVCVKFLRAE